MCLFVCVCTYVVCVRICCVCSYSGCGGGGGPRHFAVIRPYHNGTGRRLDPLIPILGGLTDVKKNSHHSVERMAYLPQPRILYARNQDKFYKNPEKGLEDRKFCGFNLVSINSANTL